MEELSEQQVRKMEEKFHSERSYYERKIKQYEETLQKYSRVLGQGKREEMMNRTNNTSHMQSFTTIIP